MNRTLLYLVLTILAAGWLGHLIAKDPGYVLFSYDGTTLQTSLWFLSGTVVGILVILHFVRRFIRALINTGGSLSSWKTARQHNKALSRTTSGLVNLIEGNWPRARDLLIQGAQESPTPLVNYLAAAKAADQLGDSAKKEHFLNQAREHAKGAESAIGIFQARLAADNGNWQDVVTILAQLKPSGGVNRLLMNAYCKLEDWAAAKDLLPQFKKTATAQEYAAAEQVIWHALLHRAASQLEVVQKLWKQLPGSLKRDPLLLATYTECLLSHNSPKEAEVAVRKAVEEKWQPNLVMLYSRINAPDKQSQIKTAESWLKEHADDAAAHLCLGQLYLSAGDEEKASVHLEKSKSIKVSVDVLKLLARLKAKSGNMAASNEFYQLALESAIEGKSS